MLDDVLLALERLIALTPVAADAQDFVRVFVDRDDVGDRQAGDIGRVLREGVVDVDFV